MILLKVNLKNLSSRGSTKNIALGSEIAKCARRVKKIKCEILLVIIFSSVMWFRLFYILNRYETFWGISDETTNKFLWVRSLKIYSYWDHNASASASVIASCRVRRDLRSSGFHFGKYYNTRLYENRSVWGWRRWSSSEEYFIRRIVPECSGYY